MASTTPPLSRDSLLWLLVAVLVVLAPHVPRQPPWVGSFVIVIWAWRGWIACRGQRQPRRVIIIALALASAFATLATYHTLLGRDAGVVLLQLMLALKLLEMRSQRDAMVAVFLGFFVVLTHFLYSQTLAMGAYMMAAIWLLVTTLVALNRNDEPSPFHLARASTVIMLQSLPLMLVLFLLVPRVPGPLWGMPKDASAGVSGLSEEMSPGSIGSLALSDGIAFRAEFDGAIPPPQRLYWRAVVMNEFDGRTWRATRARGTTSPVRGTGDIIDYRLTIEPHSRRWVFALDLPNRVPQELRLTADYQLVAAAPITNRARFELSSFLDYRMGADVSAEALASSLKLPPGNPRAIALAQSFRERGATPDVIVRLALDYFGAQAFSYTLTPPLLANDPMDGFLFDSKAGFCEHYAGAFTFLMRAAGIPARVVTGYQGGEVNPIGRYLMVRQADAHAWSEVWLPERGWVRVDPTAAVSPERIDSGIRSALPESSLIPGLATVEQLEWLRSFRLSWDAVNNEWNQWVIGYNFERQKRLMAQLGQKDASWQDLTVMLMIACAAVVAALSAFLLLRRVRRKRDPAQAAYENFCARLAKLGIERQPFEGPMDFSRRVQTIRPELGPAAAAITAIYVVLRYGDGAGCDHQQLRRMVSAFPSGG